MSAQGHPQNHKNHIWLNIWSILGDHISKTKQGNMLNFSLSDNGKGFDLESILKMDFNHRGIGLITMEERARLVGGKLSIISQPGKGTTIVLSVPIPSDNAAETG